MNAKEEYTIRFEMAEMHEEFLSRMSEAYDNNDYVETVWYCYAIFEQRINRLISKYIDKCTLAGERKDDKTVSISTRISCLKKVIEAKYGVFYLINPDLLTRISKWCEDRNELVHGLISLKHYKHYDQEFKSLAEKGVPMVFELYDICSTVRKEWYSAEQPAETFPVKKCRCSKTKCINAKNI